MTKEQLQWAMYEAYVAQLLNRIEAQEAEVAKLGTMAEQTRDDAVTRAAADEKRIEAMRQERDDMRAALAKEQELHAATALRMATDAAKMVEKKHPVKAGEWVTDGYKARQVCKVFADWYLLSTGHDWTFDHCTPCDPPTADHDTPEGKDAAESVIRDDRKTEPGVEVVTWGDLVEVYQATGNFTYVEDVGVRGVVTTIVPSDKTCRLRPVEGYKAAQYDWVSLCDVRKVTT